MFRNLGSFIRPAGFFAPFVRAAAGVAMPRAATSRSSSGARGLRAAVAFALGIAVGGAARADAGIGDSRASVLTTYGKPNSVAKRGNREIFLYPKGGRIELIDGRVADVKGPLPAVAAAAPAAAAPGIESAPAVPAADAKSPAVAAQPPSTAPAKAAAPKVVPPTPAHDDGYSPAAAANELAKHVEKMDTAWGSAPIDTQVHSPLESWPMFIAGLLLRLTITVVALKLAFKFWEMDAFWTGIAAIAGIDLALHAGLELLGPATGGFTTLGPVEHGIPGLVLIYTVNRFCFNKRLQNAVLTAAAVKTIVTLCYIFVGVAALNAVFG